MKALPKAIVEAMNAQGVKVKSRAKYRAVKSIVNGIKFDSKAEAEYYKYLKLQKGLIILRQVPFDLPGGVKYRADFMTITGHEAEGKHFTSVRVIDVKGMDTPVSKLKRKQVKDLYGMRIEVLKAQYSKGKICGFEAVM